MYQIFCSTDEKNEKELEFLTYKIVLLLVTRPLSTDGGMAGDHGAPESGKLSRVWTRGRKETKSCQKLSGAKSP